MMRQAWMLLILLALACGSAGAMSFVDWGDGYTYACYDNHADTQGNNYYAWSLRNESYTAQITNWTWSGGVVGVLPGSESLEAEFPLPMATGIRPWYNTFYRSDDPSEVVISTIWWSDGRTVEVPIVMPVSAVPEPAGFIALAASLVALCGIRRRGNHARP